ncbi:hypothetical protein [Clostridium polynesiense]|uniref:hypothetical protein n=1 Tax=Clostridium polynesiense TaxID=1325933 RepID=UPI00058E967E|nr:hypothetical protein [Clostridium polynesiense]
MENNNNNNNQLAPHEAAELHEIISGGVLGYKKLQAAMPMVKDAELKTFIEESISGIKVELDEMQNLMNTLQG